MNDDFFYFRITLLEAFCIDSVEKKERYIKILKSFKAEYFKKYESSPDSPHLLELLEQHLLQIEKISPPGL